MGCCEGVLQSCWEGSAAEPGASSNGECRVRRFVIGEDTEALAEIEKRLADLEKKKRDDGWRKLQIMGSVMMPLVIAGVGTFFTLSMRAKQAQEQTSQLVLSVIAERESADAATRARMFEALLRLFFQTEPGLEEKVTLIHLMQTNFAESFDARPLFEALHRDKSADDKLKQRLRKIAREAVGRQELFLNTSTGKTFYAGRREQVVFSVGDHELTLTVLDFDEDRVRVKLDMDRDFPLGPVEFDVTYYDMPLTDYTTLRDGHRFAITFKGLYERDDVVVAKLSAFEFDQDRILPRDRPTLADLRRLMNEIRRMSEDEETHHDEQAEDVAADLLPPLPRHISARGPGLYLKESVRRGELIVETMLSIATANGDRPALDRPADLAHVLGGCFARDMKSGERLEWTDIQACE